MTGFERIWFKGIVGIENTNFLLGTSKGIYRLTLPARAPYRVVDEAYLSQIAREILEDGLKANTDLIPTETTSI